MTVEWTDQEWKDWRANNLKLLDDGWKLGSKHMVDGSVHEYAEKNGEIIDRTPEPWK